MRKQILTEISSLWQIAWPILIGQLATVGMSVADVAMTGHLSVNDLAAVSLGSSIWVIVLVTVMGIMIAINAVVAHDVGALNFERIPHIMRQSMWMALGVGIVACVALNLSTFIFDYLYLEPIVHQKASEFVHVISIGMPAFAMFRALYSYTTSLNLTIPIMVIAIIGLVFNICMNWLLIYGNWGLPQLGSTGCALATALGMWLMLACLFFWIKFAQAYQATYPFTHYEAPNWHEIRSMLRLGLPIGVTYFAEVSAFCAVGLLVARFGVVPISANQIALNFSSLTFMVPMSIGLALTTRVSQTLGEGNFAKARFVSLVGVGVVLVFAVISAILLAMFRFEVSAAYTPDPQVQMVAASLLLLAAIFQLSDAAQVTFSCALRGYKITRIPMFIHIMAFYGVALPVGYILGLAPDWIPFSPDKPLEAEGFWIGLVLGLTVAAVLLGSFLHKHTTKSELSFTDEASK